MEKGKGFLKMATAGIKEIKNIIAIGSGKGGVGKSTVTTNLAYALSKLGFNVGILDADIYGPSQTGLLGSEKPPVGQDGFIAPLDKSGLKYISMGSFYTGGNPAIMRAPMAVKAISQFLNGVLWGQLDYLLIDLPPGTGDIQLSIGQQVHLAGVIIVTTPQKIASEIAKKGLQMFNTLNAPILGVVENMSGFTCGNCHSVTAPFKKGGGKNLAREMNVPFLGELPLDPDIMMSCEEGVNLQELNNGETVAAKAFLQMAKLTEENLRKISIETSKTEPEKIEHDEMNVKVHWKDGTSTGIDVYTLRIECPCALCVDENSGEKILRPQDIPLTIKARDVKAVGLYGIMIEFSDGHNKGIYRFSRLREMAKTEQKESISL